MRQCTFLQSRYEFILCSLSSQYRVLRMLFLLQKSCEKAPSQEDVSRRSRHKVSSEHMSLTVMKPVLYIFQADKSCLFLNLSLARPGQDDFANYTQQQSSKECLGSSSTCDPKLHPLCRTNMSISRKTDDESEHCNINHRT